MYLIVDENLDCEGSADTIFFFHLTELRNVGITMAYLVQEDIHVSQQLIRLPVCV